MSFMRSFREFMMRALAGMQGRKRQKIRCGIWAEGDDTSASGRNSLYVPLLLTKYKKIFLRFEKIDYI